MSYDLSRVDYTLCGITYPDTLKILPASDQKLKQRFVVGDKNGVLQCLSIKDEEPVVNFKTLPGKPITCVQLGSPAGNTSDKIFTASGNEVKGYNKKGKVFFAIETSVSETITSMSVIGNDLILCSGRTITFYRDLQELYTYICDDRVLDSTPFSTPNSVRVRLLVIIANKEALIVENGKLLQKLYVSAGPTSITVPPFIGHVDVSAIYGSADGSIGVLSYQESELNSKCLVPGAGLGSVTCLGWLNNSSGYHLAVGRHDGSIQLHLLNSENLNDKPRLKFTYFSGEPVTSVCGGVISTDEPELIAATFSGRIFGLRSNRFMPGNISSASLDVLATRRSKLEAEVAKLEKQAISEREKYQRNTRSFLSGVSVPPLLEIEYELTGATHNNWQEVKLISAVPLDVLFVYCENKLEIQTDSTAVLSICTQQENNSPELLATIRCQAGTRRLWMRIRILDDKETKMEGTRVLIYVLPTGAPRVARLIKLYLSLLPHYSKYESPDIENKQRPCELNILGPFSVAEMTAWLSQILPGELPRPSTTVIFARSHTTLGSFLICQYKRGSATFKSNNISTITLIKDFITNCCIRKNIRADVNCEIPEDCCLNAFKLLEDKFKSVYNYHKECEIKNAISSLDLDENVIKNETEPVLCSDYLRILNSLPKEDNTKETFEALIGNACTQLKSGTWTGVKPPL
nr:Bardet-Biedl syndrome 7 protein homolog [Danaus plexippus plexippus]